MSELVVQRPWNVVHEGKAQYVSNDVFNIAQRLADLDPRLRLVLHDAHEKPWVIVEKCGDGQERFVKRYAELDARMIEDIQRMRAVPFEERWRVAQAEEEKANAAIGKADPETMERLAFDMRKAMEADNMIDPKFSRVSMNVPRTKTR